MKKRAGLKKVTTIEQELRNIRSEIAQINKRLDALEDAVRDIHGCAKEIDMLRAEVRTLMERIEKCEARHS